MYIWPYTFSRYQLFFRKQSVKATTVQFECSRPKKKEETECKCRVVLRMYEGGVWKFPADDDLTNLYHSHPIETLDELLGINIPSGTSTNEFIALASQRLLDTCGPNGVRLFSCRLMIQRMLFILGHMNASTEGQTPKKSRH